MKTVDDDVPIRALLLDADGVVQQPPAGWRQRIAELCGDARPADAFLADVFAAERPCLTGERSFEEALGEVLRSWQVETSLADALALWTLIEAESAVLALVKQARRSGLTVGLATNQQAHRAAWMTDRLGYAAAFDHLFYSCDLGCAKPSPDYFRACLETLGCASGEVLFVDDHQANVDAARSLGLRGRVYHLRQGIAGLRRTLADHGVDLDRNGG